MYINSEVADVLLRKKWYVAPYVRTAYQSNFAERVIDKDNTSEMRGAMSVRGLTIKFLSLFCHFENLDDFGSYFEVTNERPK